MRYTFNNPETDKQQTVEIDDSWINKQCSLLGISKREAIYMWLSDEGYITNEIVAELTQKAKANGVSIHGESTKPRKKPERKPDYEKRTVIAALADYLREYGGNLEYEIENVEVTNIERVITFTVGDNKFELTLSKKRKPKN